MLHRTLAGPVRRRRLMATVGVVALLVITTGACDGIVQGYRINDARAQHGLNQLTSSAVLSGAAQAHAQAMCDAGTVSASPPGSYDQETATDVHELVGAAMGTPTDADPFGAARDQIFTQWKTDPAMVDAKYTEQGSGSVRCADGKLYMTAVLRQPATMPASGLYSTPQYADADVQFVGDVQFSTAPNAAGVTAPLLMNLYLPPGPVTTSRPTVVDVHGGSFVGGERSGVNGDMREYARRGFVGVSIDYRLITVDRLNAIGEVGAAQNALPDVQQAVRFLKANAATYGIDPARIALLGNSAGAALSLGVGVSGNTPTTGPLSGYSPEVAAVVSNGAYLTPALPFITLNDHEAPTMMFQYQMDEATHVTSAYTFQTCDALRAAGSTCDEVEIAGTGHTTWLVAGGPWWTSKLGPFLYQQLHLGS